MKIIVDPGSFARSNQGSVTGRIHCDIGGVSFPDCEWNDFVIVILEWWIRSWLSSSASEFEFRFMDGPFALRFEKSSNSADGEYLVLSDDGDEKRTLRAVRRFDVFSQLATAADTALAVCSANQWRDGDIIRLEEMSERLKMTDSFLH